MNTDDKITVDGILIAAERLKNWPHQTGPFKIHTAGTGIPDKTLIDFYKDIDQIIIARDGTEWLRGEEINA